MEPTELPDELASIRRINIYKIPPDYFTNLAEEVMAKVNMPVLANMPLSAPPANYFTNLADVVLSKIKKEQVVAQSEVQQELEDIEPLLTHITKTNVYTVPKGYFDNFTVAVPEIKKPARVIKMRRPSAWLSSAVAAAITGVIAISIVFSARDNTAGVINGSAYSNALSKVPDNEISSYLITTSPEPEVTLQDGGNTAESDTGLKTLLDNVSDNEIQNYLSEDDDVK